MSHLEVWSIECIRLVMRDTHHQAVGVVSYNNRVKCIMLVVFT